MYNESKFYRHIGPVSPEKLTDLHNQKMVYFSVVSIALVLQRYSSMFYWELVTPLINIITAGRAFAKRTPNLRWLYFVNPVLVIANCPSDNNTVYCSIQCIALFSSCWLPDYQLSWLCQVIHLSSDFKEYTCILELLTNFKAMKI